MFYMWSGFQLTWKYSTKLVPIVKYWSFTLQPPPSHPHKCKKKHIFLDEMGHLHFLLDEMGLDEMG